ncbi:hypothetical protein [Novosphingobium sp.]|uniref:hypothetical protein n=1 Tax=Novosphingobium sp. TaxID=1874826 RepID=UPI0026309FB2|nr:hypothetical protein [Novosphingobium sp.]
MIQALNEPDLISRFRETLETVLQGLDQANLQQAAIHVDMALNALGELHPGSGME